MSLPDTPESAEEELEFVEDLPEQKDLWASLPPEVACKMFSKPIESTI